jgi:hypothetical protein
MVSMTAVDTGTASVSACPSPMIAAAWALVHMRNPMVTSAMRGDGDGDGEVVLLVHGGYVSERTSET